MAAGEARLTPAGFTTEGTEEHGGPRSSVGGMFVSSINE